MHILQNMVVAWGGMSGKVKYLIVGIQDVGIVKNKEGFSSKIRKAIDLIDAGRDIRIIHGKRFSELMDTEE